MPTPNALVHFTAKQLLNSLSSWFAYGWEGGGCNTVHDAQRGFGMSLTVPPLIYVSRCKLVKWYNLTCHKLTKPDSLHSIITTSRALSWTNGAGESHVVREEWKDINMRLWSSPPTVEVCNALPLLNLLFMFWWKITTSIHTVATILIYYPTARKGRRRRRRMRRNTGRKRWRGDEEEEEEKGKKRK